MSPTGVSVNTLTVPLMSTCCPQAADAGGGGGDIAGACASAGAITNAKHAPKMTSFFILILVTLIRTAGCHDFPVMAVRSISETLSSLAAR
jgi:hypothetical protein